MRRHGLECEMNRFQGREESSVEKETENKEGLGRLERLSRITYYAGRTWPHVRAENMSLEEKQSTEKKPTRR